MKKLDNLFNKNNITIFPFTKIIGIENISFGKNIIIDDFVFISAKKEIKLGSYIHIACFSSIVGSESVIMEDFSCLSHGCRIFTSSDDFVNWGFGNPTVPFKYRNVKSAPVKIGKFCAIGANSVILPGVSIGEGVTVGANSVITKDLEPWGVHIGNKRIRERNKDAVLKNYSRLLKEFKEKC